MMKAQLFSLWFCPSQCNNDAEHRHQMKTRFEDDEERLKKVRAAKKVAQQLHNATDIF